MERSHAELQQHHYQAVRENPMYAAEGMMDVMLEELSMNIPAYEPPLEQEPEPEWTRHQWDIVQQLRAQVQYLQKQVVTVQQPDDEGSARPRKIGVRIE